jgi:hypothetical protein
MSDQFDGPDDAHHGDAHHGDAGHVPFEWDSAPHDADDPHGGHLPEHGDADPGAHLETYDESDAELARAQRSWVPEPDDISPYASGDDDAEDYLLAAELRGWFGDVPEPPGDALDATVLERLRRG